tara:strand:+ start:2848 stop:3126 length:279 start_codon:yes stop_codon:yes gene_type:complete
MSCDQFVLDQIARLETLLSLYLDAITTLLTAGATKSYSLDTGQGRQQVTREDVDKLQETYGLLWQQYDSLKARCNGGGAVQVLPYGATPWIR